MEHKSTSTLPKKPRQPRRWRTKHEREHSPGLAAGPYRVGDWVWYQDTLRPKGKLPEGEKAKKHQVCLIKLTGFWLRRLATNVDSFRGTGYFENSSVWTGLGVHGEYILGKATEEEMEAYLVRTRAAA